MCHTFEGAVVVASRPTSSTSTTPDALNQASCGIQTCPHFAHTFTKTSPDRRDSRASTKAQDPRNSAVLAPICRLANTARYSSTPAVASTSEGPRSPCEHWVAAVQPPPETSRARILDTSAAARARSSEAAVCLRSWMVILGSPASDKASPQRRGELTPGRGRAPSMKPAARSR